jgi:nucleoside-diphosphate-sugar epimerase
MLRLDLVVNNLAAWAYTAGKIKIMSDGSPWRPLIHVQDFSRAFIAVIKAPLELIHNQMFNVGQNNENYQVKDIADTIKEIIPSCVVEFTGEHGTDTRTYKVDFTKITDVLKNYFQPLFSLSKGVEELYAAYKHNKLNYDVFIGNRYIRIKHLSLLREKGKLDREFYWTKK